MEVYYKKNKPIAIIKFSKIDLEKIKKHKWHIQNKCIATKINGINFKLHHLIKNKINDLVIDHINGDYLDNTRDNLRYARKKDNCRNRVAKGITFIEKKKRWVAQIGVDYKVIYLGIFKTKTEATIIRREAEQKYFGKFAYNY